MPNSSATPPTPEILLSDIASARMIFSLSLKLSYALGRYLPCTIAGNNFIKLFFI